MPDANYVSQIKQLIENQELILSRLELYIGMVEFMMLVCTIWLLYKFLKSFF